MESRHDSGFLGHTIIYLKPGLGQGSGPGIASHSFAMTSLNSSLLNATWYESKELFSRESTPKRRGLDLPPVEVYDDCQ